MAIIEAIRLSLYNDAVPSAAGAEALLSLDLPIIGSAAPSTDADGLLGKLIPLESKG